MTVLSARPTSVGHSDVDGDVHAVRFIGEPDASTTPPLPAAAKTLRAEFPGDRTLHVGDVTFADSALLNAIVAFRADLPRRGRASGGRV